MSDKAAKSSGVGEISFAELPEEHKNQQWADFKGKFARQYNEDEENVRKNIFMHNLETVHVHNQKHARGEVTWEMGLNQFSDQTKEEIRPYTWGVNLPTSK